MKAPRFVDPVARVNALAPEDGPVEIVDLDDWCRTLIRNSIVIDRAIITAGRNIPPYSRAQVKAAWQRAREALAREYDEGVAEARAIQVVQLERDVTRMLASNPVPHAAIAMTRRLIADITGTKAKTEVSVESNLNVKFDVRVRSALMTVTAEYDADTFERLAEGYEVPQAAE